MLAAATKVLPSSIGPVGLAATGESLLYVQLPLRPRESEVSAGKRLHAWCHAHGLEQSEATTAFDLLERVNRQIQQYLLGERTRFDLPIHLGVAPFAHRVLEALAEIPYGSISTYGTIARQIGAPKAARAVGHACGRNPLPLLIPCHRVVGAQGALVGFARGKDGLWLKAALLELEQAPAAARPLELLNG